MDEALSRGKIVPLPIATTVTYQEAFARKELVASWRAAAQGEARHVEVSLQQQSPEFSFASLPIYAGQGDQLRLPNGAIASSIEPQYAGFFVLEYGCGALAKTRIVDLTSARYYLGVCDQVTVSAARWRQAQWPLYFNPNVFAGATITTSIGVGSDEMTNTQQKYIAAGTDLAASPIFFAPPDGAVCSAVAMGQYAPTTTSFWGSAEPDFNFQAQGLGYEGFLFRPSQYAVVPPFRRSATAALLELQAPAVTLNALVATVQWYLTP